MKYSRSVFFILGFGAVLLLSGCSQPLTISNVDYSQPIETVLEPDENGVVRDVQHGLQFSILPLQFVETQDTSSVSTREIRMIRGREGFYYITAPGFKNVYVMRPDQNGLELKKKLKVNEEGLSEPAFNQRNSYIQLLNRGDNETYSITADEIRKTEHTDTGSNEEAR